MSDLSPRTYKPAGSVLNQSYATMLQEHPEAFDCIIYSAKSSEHDEIIADNEPVGTLLDRDERGQEYEPPILGRAMIAPKMELAFDATDSGLFESFHAASDSIALLLSENGLRKHSLVQWEEYLTLEGDETVERVVYIADMRPMGRTLNAGMIYICYPLPAMGEKPDAILDPDNPKNDINLSNPGDPNMPEIEANKDRNDEIGIL